MRILQLVSAFAYSGPAVPTLALARDLRDQGHDVVVGFDTLRPHGNQHEEGIGPAVAALDLAVAQELALSTRSGPVAWLRDRSRLAARMAGVDVVHVHFSHDHALAALARPASPRPVVVRTVHAERSLRPRPGQAWLLRRADALVVHAHAQVDHAVNVLGLPREHLHVIRGPVDHARFHVERREERGRAFRHAHGIPADAPLAVMVAIFQQGRGHDRVLSLWPRVVERVPGARLAFVGLGELRDAAMKRAVDERIPGLHFVGYLKDALPDAYAAAHVSLLLAIGNDGYGRALLESMASGTPCVVPAGIPAVAEVVQHAGVGSTAADDDAVVDALVQHLRADVSAQRDAAHRARAHVEQHHGQDAITRAHVDLYERLLA